MITDRPPTGLRAQRGVIIALLGMFAIGGAGRSAVGSEDKLAFLGVRVLKTQAARELFWSVELPRDCTRCRLENNVYTSGQDSKSIFFHFWAPETMSRVRLTVRLNSGRIRGVLVSRSEPDLPKADFSRPEGNAKAPVRIPYTSVNDAVTFEVPVAPDGKRIPQDDIGDVTEFYTYVETPGVYVRVAHGDKDRRRGAYASGPWPDREWAASVNLEFAAREAVTELGLDRRLQDVGVQTIMIMNFDTSYPTLGPTQAHDDWPPHWHMHLYWRSSPHIRKIGHFYLDRTGLLLQNASTTLMSTPAEANWSLEWYARGAEDRTMSDDERLLYSQTITPQGYFQLKSGSGSCQFSPSVAGHGFESGVDLKCTGHALRRGIHVTDHVQDGLLELFIDNKRVQQYHYDTDSGELISPRSTRAMPSAADTGREVTHGG